MQEKAAEDKAASTRADAGHAAPAARAATGPLAAAEEASAGAAGDESGLARAGDGCVELDTQLEVRPARCTVCMLPTRALPRKQVNPSLPFTLVKYLRLGLMERAGVPGGRLLAWHA